MTQAHDQDQEQYGPWNPGIESQLPRAYLPLSTLFRPENVATTVAEAEELSDFCGLPAHELVVIRPQRLVVHELLIRVMANVAVPDGPNYEDLGINFRRITDAILTRHLAARMDEIVAAFDALIAEAHSFIDDELGATLFARRDRTPTRRRGLLARLGLGASPQPATPPRPLPAGEAGLVLVERWRHEAESAPTPLERGAYQALSHIAAAVIAKRGRLVGDRQLLVSLAVTAFGNHYGSEFIGAMIEDDIRAAAEREGFPLLRGRSHPIMMNVKGASAAGKSTMRPLQRKLAQRLGVNWEDFALISPDIWRKYLLDYDALGEAWRYAGTLTGHEIEIIDKKLDRYMAAKAAAGDMPHLLIDRFRFDSFTSGEGEGGRLLTRFGKQIFMFFMITPPEATVERAWKRGLQFGRYKAVDDLLDHNVEAYTGMPRLFFTWARRADKEVHFEFLDNSVPEGSQPRTIAFGLNGEMNILDIKVMLDVDRYAKIDISARSPDEIYPDAQAMAPEHNTEFLRQCARAIPVINFVEYESGAVYARLENGRLTCTDRATLARVSADPEVRAGLAAVAQGPLESLPGDAAPRTLDRAASHTLGRWGAAAAP